MANAISSLSYGENTYSFTLPYGVCSTAADTVDKTVTVPNFSLETGATVIVKFTYANSIASPTLNVNNTGAKPIYRYGTTVASTGTTTTGWVAGAVQMFTYDGSGWIRDYWNNTTYSNASLGQGYCTCSTAAATVAKTASLSSYSLTAGGIVAVRFTNGNTASSPTLNINSKGAKPIYYNGAALTDTKMIEAGDVVTFMYSTQYHLLCINKAGVAGTGISIDNYTINHSNSVTAGTASEGGSARTLAHSGTFNVPSISYDSEGHVTSKGSTTLTLPAQYSLPTASSSTLGGVKVGSNLSISSGKLSVPDASDATAGVTKVYPAAKCTTYTSDSGTCTPLAVQNAVKKFGVTRPTSSTTNAVARFSNTTGDLKDSKITIEDVTNSKDSSKQANVLVIPAEGNKKMVYGYCTDQVDGTSFIGGVFDKSATSYPYASGLAIGGTSGNLLWKGSRVLDNNDLTTINSSISSHTHKYAGSASAGGAANSSVSDTPVTTAGTGAAYTATVPGITALTAGVSFIMVPNVVSTSTTPTLNVNSLGAKTIKRRLSNLATSLQSGYTASWLAKGKPFRVTYDGTYWVVEGMEKPVSADLYGTVAVDKGGTGATTAAAALTNLGITYGTTDLTAGTSELATGAIYLVYE